MEFNKPISLYDAFTSPFYALAELKNRQESFTELEKLEKQAEPFSPEQAKQKETLKAKIDKLEENQLTSRLGIKSRAIAVFCVFFFNVGHITSNVAKFAFKAVVCIPCEMIDIFLKIAGKSDCLSNYHIIPAVEHAVKVIYHVAVSPVSILTGIFSPQYVMNLHERFGIDDRQIFSYNKGRDEAIDTDKKIEKHTANIENNLAAINKCYLKNSALPAFENMRSTIKQLDLDINFAKDWVDVIKWRGKKAVANAKDNLARLEKTKAEFDKKLNQAEAQISSLGNEVTMVPKSIYNFGGNMLHHAASRWNKPTLVNKI